MEAQKALLHSWPVVAPMAAARQAGTGGIHRRAHSQSHSKKRSWMLRCMRKYDITPAKAGCWLLFLLTLGFLLYQFLTPSPPPTFPAPPPPPLTADGSSFTLPPLERSVTLQSEEAKRLAELHRGAVQGAGSNGAAPNPSLSPSELEKFFSEQRLKEQEHGNRDVAATATGRFELNFGQPKQWQPDAAAAAAAAAATSIPAVAKPPKPADPVFTVPETPTLTNPGSTPAPEEDIAHAHATKGVSNGDHVLHSANQAASDLVPSSTETVVAAHSAAHSDHASSSSAKPAVKADQSKLSGASMLTSPPAPLGDDVDVSRLYDTPERRQAREAKIAELAASPLPEEVRKRKINNVNLAAKGEAPWNEEWSELLQTQLAQSVSAPSVLTSLTSPDGGLELKVFLTAEGRIGYSTAMRGRYSTLARQMKEEGAIQSLDEASGTFMLPALLDLSVDNTLCLLPLTSTGSGADSKKTASLNWQVHKGFSLWHPVPKAERREYAESWTQLTLWNGISSGKDAADEKLGPCGAVQYQFRVFNRGLAVRALVQPLKKSPSTVVDDSLTPTEAGEGEFVLVHWSMGLRLQDGLLKSRCIANNYEEPFVRISCASMADAMMTPLTLEQASTVEGQGLKKAGEPARGPRVLAVAQAGGPLFVRSTAVAAPRDPAHPWQTQLILLTKGEAPTLASMKEDDLGVEESLLPGATGQRVSATSWHVVLMGASIRHLPHTSHLTPLLCAPPSASKHPAHADSRWVPHGKLMRITKFATAPSKAIIDWASAPERGFKLVLFDAGYYGDEYKKESSALAVHPTFAKDLDIKTVASYATEHGMRLCLYVNELALRDTPQLVKLYKEQWGVGGIKFGFVEVGDPRSMRILHQRILAFGNAGVYINVHDSYRPRGLTRTWPFLVTQEGVRGEERKPDATHHTILPFVRTLQGSADYTPRYLNGAGLRCTKAHQLALPLAIYSPIQSLFWAEPLEPVSQAVAKWNRELDVWMRMPASWDDTRFLAGALGAVVAVARRNGNDWFVGVMSNELERELTLDLGVLFDDWAGHPPLPPALAQNKVGLLAHVYRDGYFAQRKDPFSVKAAPRVLRWVAPPSHALGEAPAPKAPAQAEELKDGIITMTLAPSGGQALYITPATPEALEEATAIPA